MDEETAVAQAKRGDHDAFMHLVALHDRQLMAVVRRFTHDQYDREDLYQDIFLHVFKSIRSFRGRSSFNTWLYRLALNRCMDWNKRRTPVLEPSDQAAPGVDWEQRRKLTAVHKAMGHLSDKERVCFHLHYVEEWRPGEIAEMLGCREGTVKSNLNRARQKIRKDKQVAPWLTL